MSTPFTTPKPFNAAIVTSTERDLILDDLLLGGDVVPIEIPDLLAKNGEPGIAYYRQLSALDVLEFGDMPGDTPEQIRARNLRPFQLLGKCLCDRAGNRRFTDEEAESGAVMKLTFPVLTALTTGMFKAQGLITDEKEIQAAAAAVKEGDTRTVAEGGALPLADDSSAAH